MSGQSGLRVLAAPAWINKRDNPLNFLLSNAEQAIGARVVEWGMRTSIFSQADIVHVHWPENWLSGDRLTATSRAVGLLARLAAQKLRGARIVWTVHNVKAHSPKLRTRDALFRGPFVSLVDGLIFLSESSRRAALAERPQLAIKPSAVIPLGGNGSAYPEALPRDQARAYFNLDRDGRVIGFIGDIKRYKGLDRILDAMGIGDFDGTLLIAGHCRDDEYRQELAARIDRLHGLGRKIVCLSRRLSDQELIDSIAACDIVALPYREIWNSSAALLFIEQGARLLTSDLPLFRELRDELGADWIDILDTFSPDGIERALKHPYPDEQGERRRREFVRRRDWSEIARRTLAFFGDIRK